MYEQNIRHPVCEKNSCTTSLARSATSYARSLVTFNACDDVSGKLVEKDLSTSVSVDSFECLVEGLLACTINQLWHLCFELLQRHTLVSLGTIFEDAKDLVVQETIFYELFEFILVNETILVTFGVWFPAADVPGNFGPRADQWPM